jgi:hypothetical protein
MPKEEVLITCNGRELTVRRVGAVKIRLLARTAGPPIKPCGWRLVEEDAASIELRELVNSAYYEIIKGEA